MGNLSNARGDITKAIQLARQEKDTTRLVRSFIIQADIHLKQEQSQEAIAVLHEAKKIADEHHLKLEMKSISDRIALCSFPY